MHIMRIQCVLITVIMGATSAVVNAATTLVDWQSPEGIRRLERAHAKQDFFALANHFEPQINASYCGVASAVIVLNTLRLGDTNIARDDSSIPKGAWRYIRKGRDPRLHKFTQHTVFSGAAAPLKSPLEVFGKPIKGKRDVGFQLHQLRDLFAAHDVATSMHVVSPDTDTRAIKRELIANLRTPHDYVVINYSRKALGQAGGGHISPLAAYDRRSDSFLVMDVNPNRAPWSWVSSTALIAAMRTFDTIENRGFLQIARKTKDQQ